VGETGEKGCEHEWAAGKLGAGGQLDRNDRNAPTDVKSALELGYSRLQN
jgi:hypothetical protein